MQEHTTAELGLLRGDVGELRGELNNQITRISDVEESMSNKIAEVEKSVLSEMCIRDSISFYAAVFY